MEIKGKLKKVHDVVERGDFKSRKIWIETAENPQYPQTIEIEVNQANIDKFNGIAIGSEVNCGINLRGRLWTGTDNVEKCFNTLVCWKVEVLRGIDSGLVTSPILPPELPKGDLPF